jgi:putative transposase
VVVDLFSRKIIDWSIQSRMAKDIILNALLMAVWRRNPKTGAGSFGSGQSVHKP